MIVVIFMCFVFKQKTAYELRISDWSSDVCSSDLARLLGDNGASFADAWNFGPEPQAFLNVETLARTLCDAWGAGAPPLRLGVGGGPHEAGMLTLDSSKAHAALGWRPRLSSDEAIRLTAQWYRAHANGDTNLRALSLAQLDAYSGGAPLSSEEHTPELQTIM